MPGPGIEPPTSGMPNGCANHYITDSQIKNDIKSILRDESKNKSRKQYEA